MASRNHPGQIAAKKGKVGEKPINLGWKPWELPEEEVSLQDGIWQRLRETALYSERICHRLSPITEGITHTLPNRNISRAHSKCTYAEQIALVSYIISPPLGKTFTYYMKVFPPLWQAHSEVRPQGKKHLLSPYVSKSRYEFDCDAHNASHFSSVSYPWIPVITLKKSDRGYKKKVWIYTGAAKTFLSINTKSTLSQLRREYVWAGTSWGVNAAMWQGERTELSHSSIAHASLDKGEQTPYYEDIWGTEEDERPLSLGLQGMHWSHLGSFENHYLQIWLSKLERNPELMNRVCVQRYFKCCSTSIPVTNISCLVFPSLSWSLVVLLFASPRSLQIHLCRCHRSKPTSCLCAAQDGCSHSHPLWERSQRTEGLAALAQKKHPQLLPRT